MIGQEQIFPTSTARNIGVVLDAHLDMAAQVTSVCTSYIQPQHQQDKKIPHIRSNINTHQCISHIQIRLQ